MTTKYGKYIFNEPHYGQRRNDRVMRIDSSLMDTIGLEFAFIGQKQPSDDKHPTHTHDVDEYLFFMGGENILDFGAEVELTLGTGEDQEKHVINKSSIVYIPAGLPHLPWAFKNVTKPIIRGHILVAPSYRQTEL